MKIRLILTALLFFTSFASFAETAYVSDQIKVWSRTGPSNQYKVKLQVTPGTVFEILQRDAETGYVEVKDQQGRTAWIDGKLLTSKTTVYQKLAAANSQIESLKSTNASQVATLENRLNELLPLVERGQELQTKLSSQQSELEQLRQKSQMYENGFKTDAFFAGAVVILSGVFLGWLLSKISGRKRNSGWG